MTEENLAEENKMHEEKVHESHAEHKKNSESYQISKVALWQIVSAILAIALVFTWFNGGDANEGTAFVPQPTQNQPNNPIQPAPQQPTKQDISLDDDPVLGNPNAPVTIVEFSDYQCPFCGRNFQQTYPQIKSEYIEKGLAKLVFRDFPLGFHPEAQPAAEAAECAGDQGKYWEYHDGLFENQQSLGNEFYPKLAQDLNLDVAKFNECFSSGKYRQEVQDDTAYGSQVGVSGTPTFFINGIELVGAQPFANFKQIIDAELAKQ